MKKEVIIPNEKFKISEYEYFVIVADVGGNNTYVAVMGVKAKKDFDVIFKHHYQTQEIDTFVKQVNHALFEAKELYNIEVNRCCIGAAGPVSRNRGYIKLSHVDMEIRRDAILDGTMLNKVILVNDFEAIGYAVDMLNAKKDVFKIKTPFEDKIKGWMPGNTFAVFGAGAGLGVSILHYDFNRHVHVPLPSEGGHTDFAADNEEEYELIHFLKERQNNSITHPEFENVLSGKGMEAIYLYLRSKLKGEGSAIVKKIDSLEGVEKLRAIEDNYNKEKLCKKSVDMLIRFYARFARNLALMTECYSGLYICGRIAIKNKDHFKSKNFMDEYFRSDKRQNVLCKVPMYIITNTDIGLYGLCNVATNFYNIT